MTALTNQAQKIDPRRSAQFLIFENHYANFGNEIKWSVDRLHRLCAAIQLTEFEVGALLRIKINEMMRYLQRNRFPAPLELHLTLLERTVFPSSKPSVFPTTRAT